MSIDTLIHVLNTEDDAGRIKEIYIDETLIHVLNTEDDRQLCILIAKYHTLIHVLNTEDDLACPEKGAFTGYTLIHVLNTEDDAVSSARIRAPSHFNPRPQHRGRRMRLLQR